MSRSYLVAGNWKMNGSLASNQALLQGVLAGLEAVPDVQVLVCPPHIYIDSVTELCRGTRLRVGAQDVCEQAAPGAYTGETHVAMIHEFGCRHVIVGHSERRSLYGDTDERVAEKFRVAQLGGLMPILCVGEMLADRDAGNTERVLARQLEAVIAHCGVGAFAEAVIAYEPVWAIGTGRTASPEQAQAAHAFLRGQLASHDAKIADSVQILYGGSVKPSNAAELFACEDVDGGLIGGASLNARDFLGICEAAQRLS